MTDPLQPAAELNTWQEIAEYLDISVREAQYREKDDGLPVHRMGGKKPRVWALRTELDAWRKLKAEAPAITPARLQAENKTPAGRWGRRAVLGAAGLAATAAGVRWMFRTPAPRVERAALSGNLLTALDGLGRPMWTHRFPGVLQEPSSEELNWWVQVVDLEGAGRPGILAVCRYVRSSVVPVASDDLHYFGPDGDVKWTLSCRPDVLDFDGKQFEPVWRCSHVIAAPSGKQQVLWVSVHHDWRWPGCVLRIDAKGVATLQFANAGWVETLCRLTGPDGEYMLVAGENNAFDRPCAAVLGINDPPSSSPGGGAARCRFSNSPPGTPRHFMVFPLTEMLAAVDTPYGGALQLTQTNDGGFIVYVQAFNSNVAWFMYEFSEAAEPRNVMPSRDCEMTHRRLEQEGKLHHTWDACPEIHAPLAIRHWRPGKGWRDEQFPWRAATDKA